MLEDVANRVVKDPGEVPLVIHSALSGPIAELSFLRRSLLFAELAMIAYNDVDEATRAAKLAGFPDVTFYDRDGSQAYRFRNEVDCVIACRGTEPNEWNDIRADANAQSVLAETVGRVHRGFKTEVDDLWPMIETALLDNSHTLFFCGHSLGGAMATICAGRCYLSHINSNPNELFTYGSPRVGNNRYINYVKLDHYRYVNNNDIVTRVPPVMFGYRHSGSEVYIDRNGRIRKLNLISRRRDRWQGFLRGLRRWKIDHFSDHSIHQYIEAILKAVREENERVGKGEQAKPASTYADKKHARE
ncbi:lipase family protein [Roseiconus nitratireducens]|uniref:Lipase family protein n=1 Tax=Roseiconus nitratireducens TaxID=2605748 RepID=A0A5M6D9H8_9BACT|nr:lipase family protein [Roseiconus nitratireducens]KAA5543080.1 lipase family protein [Roseiconus nitratireducens]